MDPARMMSRVCMTLLSCGLFALAVSAESRNPADYPLRIHIFNAEATNFYRMRDVQESKGDGRADLYQGGQAQGVDFNFDCEDQLRSSFGYETYPARWKKQGRELIVLLPKFGQTGAYWTCNLKTDLKSFAYTRHRGVMSSEPIADFKAWMVSHEYDPEHGKDVPLRIAPEASTGAAPPAGQSAQTPH